MTDIDGLAERIRSWGAELGFQQVGIAAPDLAEAGARLRAWLARGHHADMDWLARQQDNLSRPAQLVPGTLRVIDKPLVHGAILRFDGRVTTIIPKKSACYRCVFKTPPPPGLVASCQEAGVIGVLAGIIGTIQATEALKLVLGIGRPLTDRLLDFDARKTQFREITVKRNPKCALGEQPTITELFETAILLPAVLYDPHD